MDRGRNRGLMLGKKSTFDHRSEVFYNGAIAIYGQDLIERKTDRFPARFGRQERTLLDRRPDLTPELRQIKSVVQSDC
jgi:hypothetical protein